MGDISEHFSRSEHACLCAKYGKKKENGYCGGEFQAVDKELNSCLERIRRGVAKVVGKEIYIKITGPNRCHKHNTDEGGAEHSYHPLGMAVDFSVFERLTTYLIPARLVYDIICRLYPDKYGLKLYENRVHFDIRKIKWRDDEL